MNRFVISVCCGLAILASSAAVSAQSGPSVTGTWTIQQSGANGTTTSTVKLTQSGNGIVGTNAANGNGFTGEFATGDRIDGKWHGPGGAGWLTVYVSPNGHSFNGTWGYNGRACKRLVRRQQDSAAVADHRGGHVDRYRRGRPDEIRWNDEVHAIGSDRRLPFRRPHAQRQVPDKGQSASDLGGRRQGRLVLVLVQRRQQQLQRNLGRRRRFDPAGGPRRRATRALRLNLPRA